MSVPPHPPQPPMGNQPVGGAQWGPPPPGGAPQWSPQQPWGPPAGPPPPGAPPPRGAKGKWVFGGVALIAVIAVTVVITVLVVGKNSGSSPTPTTSTTAAPSDIASANDKGPATIITEDPTCAPLRPILDTLAGQQANGWDKRDPSVGASSWTPTTRAQFDTVGQGMRRAADQIVRLAKVTPHRVVRELYEQYVAYARAYADSIPTYTARDDNYALVAVATVNALNDICSSISYGSAAARAPLIASAPMPSEVAPFGNADDPQRFLPGPNPSCGQWSTALSDLQRDTANWYSIPSDIPASGWSPEQRAIYDAAAPVMNASADKLQTLGESSGNLTWQDFAQFSAQYRRAYVQSLPSYIAADAYLANIASEVSGVVQAACQAAGGG
jgi:hypothetical protein